MLFDFGVGFWILFFVLFFGCGKACGWGARKYKQHQKELEEQRREDDRLSRLEDRIRRMDRGGRERSLPRPAVHGREGEVAEKEPARLRQKRPSALEQLQKRFIEGQLSLDEYERELDRLERLE